MTWPEARLAIGKLTTYLADGGEERPVPGTTRGRALKFVDEMEETASPYAVYVTVDTTIEFAWILPGDVKHYVEILDGTQAESMTSFADPKQSAVFSRFMWRQQECDHD